jgi:hypothetical protein
VVSRDELSPQAVAELAALDAILAREAVSEEHLELAALVDSVRSSAPAIDPGFEATLAERFAGRSRDRARSRRRAVAGRLAFAGGGLVAAAVALAILFTGSVRDDVFGGGTAPKHAPNLIVPNRSIPAERLAPHSTPRSGVAGSAATPAPPNVFAQNAGGVGGRLVAKGSTLTLATPPAQISSLASQIVSATESSGGVVEHSNVNVDGGSSSNANFTLSVPSGRLGHLIASLSSLASVRALNQSTQDITSPYDRENALLARRMLSLRSRRAQLATAPSATTAASLRSQIRAVSHRITIERATIVRLRTRASNATLSVQVVAGAAKHRKAAAAGALTRGYRDALHALQEILAIALIALAILLPFAICGLAVWWAAWGMRQRARERAIRAA